LKTDRNVWPSNPGDRQECLSYAEEIKNNPGISDAGVLEFRL
jgi:hypothetical protein